MRIVHVANFYGQLSGGIRTTMHALGQGYARAGHEMVMVVPGRHDDDEMTPFGRRITVSAPALPGNGGYRVITDHERVARRLDALAPDRLEVSDRTTLRPLGWWAQDAKVPSVLFAHERVDGVLRGFLPRTLAHALPVETMADIHNRATAASFDRIVCTTQFAAEEFTRIGSPVTQIALGVDLETFSPAASDPATRFLFADPGEVLLVMASRLSPEKRPDLAIEAVRELRRRGVPVRLVVAGTGQHDARLRAQAEGLPIRFVGRLDGREVVARLFASADVVLAPGPIETFGLAALEALACGTPVAVNGASALPEVVGEAGVAAPSTAIGFADAVEALLARDATDRRAAARARAQAYGWDRTVERMLALHGLGVAVR